MILKRILPIFLLLVNPLLYGQSVDMLNLKDQKYFSEKSLFTYDSMLTIRLQIYFDIPEMADEENYQDMFFTIKNTSDFKPGVKFDLQKDSSLIKPQYTLTGAWRFEPANSYSGYIKVLSNARSEISLYLDFTVEGQKKYIYKGQRTFTKVKHFPAF